MTKKAKYGIAEDSMGQVMIFVFTQKNKLKSSQVISG
jgi:hypothetical protein